MAEKQEKLDKREQELLARVEKLEEEIYIKAQTLLRDFGRVQNGDLYTPSMSMELTSNRSENNNASRRNSIMR